MKEKTILFFALMGITLVTGVFWGTWFTLTRSLSEFSPSEFIHIGKTIIANVALPMRIIMPLTLLAMMLAVWQSRNGNRTTLYLFAASLILMVATLIITVAVEVPIDNQIKTWTAAHLPDNWMQLRSTWERFHTIRTGASIASLTLFAAGITAVTSMVKMRKSRL